MEAIAELFISEIVKNYSAYTIPLWQGKRIKQALSLFSNEIADRLDYTSPQACVKSISRELDIDITPAIVNNKFPVWIDLNEPETSVPQNKNAVITYVESLTRDIIPVIDNIESYANKISADFILLTGRTQGYTQLEIFRVKAFAEIYDRTLFISPSVFIKDDCPSLFDEVPVGYVGIYDDKEIGSPKRIVDKKIFLLKSETFTRTGIITGLHDYSIKDELKMMDSDYDDSIILCDKRDANIWNPFTFPFRFTEGENRGWIEILIYRNGHTVFPLAKKFNHSIYDYNSDKSETKIQRYESIHRSDNVFYTYFDDNNLIGYKEKDPVDMMPFKILSLYHDEKQRDSIQRRGYIEFFNLNNMGSKFDNSFTESRIYYEDFDYLFPEEFEYIGLTTGSWNLKYIGINPIDRMHDWPAIRRLDENAVLCADTETTNRFLRERRSVLQNVFNNMSLDMIKEFLQLINLPTEYTEKQVPVSNQVIAKRSIVKSLFDFYQSNEILDKIAFFMNKYELTVREKAYGGDAYRRRSGFFAETATALWFNHNDFIIMPQEILKQDWYK